MFEKIKDFIGLGKNSSMQDEVLEQELGFSSLGKFNLGAGSIGPANRTDIDQNFLNDMYKRLANGEFNKTVVSTVPVICVDGRTRADGTRIDGPSAAGGSLTMVYGSDLGNPEAQTEKTELQLTTEIINTLKQKGFETSVHGDNHSSCGCGACAKARDVYQHIANNIDNIIKLASQYCINISDEEKSIMVKRAHQRLQQPNFFHENRSSILKAAQENGANYEELVSAHNELGIALNTRAGTTVDRAAIRAAFGPQYDIFVVDAWTFNSAAKELINSDNDQSIALIAKAIAVQNVATASVLGHASLPIIPIT
ncbi:MAG: cadmium-containing carbonic anhydrase [Nitrosomonas sp.]|nr:hypothetical protein [Nitrosomonas sp.]MDR4519099.1 cadmium-containing carbonic anhydrase [Nitrosomonas sp.]